MIELPKRDGSMHTLTDLEIGQLQKDYPKIDVRNELSKMRNWLEANPRQRKTDVRRFIINWLNRARPQAVGHVTRETSQHYAVMAERQRTPEPPPRYAPPEVASQHIEQLRRSLGMRPR